MHLRLGDRSKLIEEDFNEYVALLEAFMDKVTKSLVSRGHDKPVFHVFSETSLPCPSSGSGIFDELPTWPVEIDQVCKRQATTHANNLGYLIQQYTIVEIMVVKL